MKLRRLSKTLIPIIALTFTLDATPLFAGDDDDKADDAKPAEEEKAEDGPRADGSIPAENVELIRKSLKKAVIVHGKIAKLKTYESSGNVLFTFEDSELGIFIRKRDIDANKGWDLEALVGADVYVAGQVKLYRDQLELVIVGPDQIAVTPDNFDLAKIPLPETNKSSGGSTAKKPKAIAGAITPTKKSWPDLPLKLQEASVQTVAFYLQDTGMKIKDDPYALPHDRLMPTVAYVTAKVTERENGGPMPIKFEKPEEDSKAHIKAVVDQLAEGYGKWPKDKLLTIDVDFDSRDFKDDPSTLVIAALVESLATGKELGPDVVLSADVGDGGTLEHPHADEDGAVPQYKILKAIAENASEPLRYICTGVPAELLNDLALDGAWDALSTVSVLGAENLDEAKQLAFADPESDLGKALAAFDQAQTVIKSKGYSMVKNKHVQQRVITAGKAWPKHSSAMFYAYYGRGKVPRSYSLPYTRHIIEDMHNQLRFLQISKPGDPKEKFRAWEDKIKEMRPKIHPDLAKLARAISDFQSQAEAIVTRPRSGRALERQQERLTETDDSVIEELGVLRAKIDGVEPEAE